jgi:CBS domain-containing protein/gamma-glutamyl:cysteine ligase YbdK (ATP-grasp superfamily)
MGDHNVEKYDELKDQAFMKALLNDLRALAFMLEDGRVESGVARVGAEQEMFLVDESFRPAPVAVEVLQHANEPRLTTEIARFNLEANLTPQELSGRCFQKIEAELTELIDTARQSAATAGADVLLAGILPTLKQTDLTLDNMTPVARYDELNSGVIRHRGGSFAIHIKGVDELQLMHDNIMMESCNTSFQIHFQTSPAEFVNQYNVAQAIAAPVLAVAVNSPLLFGQRLWQETRVALFQHSTDERSRPQLARNHPTRVSFGDEWLQHSVIALFHDQIARFRPIMINEADEDPFQVLARGETPKLSALRMHNSTVWRWNRACYGVTNGVAHLRIENRALPSGPTTVDEVSNAAFFCGLMLALPRHYGDISQVMSFDDAKSNFFRAARHGLDAQFNWIDGQSISASSLVLEFLLPMAREGLTAAQVDSADIDKYLGIIEERVRSRQTGARWIIKSVAALNDAKTKHTTMQQLTSALLNAQKTNRPVHTWAAMKTNKSIHWEQSYQTVGQFMSTDLFTVRPGDLIDFAASVMDWRHIRHVPVEDENGRLVGLITHRNLLRLVSAGNRGKTASITVDELMVRDPLTVSPSTDTLAAIKLMREHRVGCLPVVEGDQLVGIVTSYDFLDATAQIFHEHLKPKSKSANMAAMRQTA